MFPPGESHGQRSLAGYSPWGPKELDMTERLTQSFVRFVTCVSAVFIGTFDEQMFLVSKVVELI